MEEGHSHERSTRFSLLVTGIFVALLLILGFALRPRENQDGQQPLAAENRRPTEVKADSDHLLPPPVPPQGRPLDGQVSPASFGMTESTVRPTTRNHQILTHCRLVTHANNDGDSFLVRVGNSNAEHRFSLYYVDAPDTNGSSPEITNSQCRYFYGLREQELRAVASEAQNYVLEALRDRDFDVVTRWEPAPEESSGGTPTYRAFVYVPGGAEPLNLAEFLVTNGLATLSRCSETLPDLTSGQVFQRNLQSLEQGAIHEQRGGWRFSDKLQPTSAHIR